MIVLIAIMIAITISLINRIKFLFLLETKLKTIKFHTFHGNKSSGGMYYWDISTIVLILQLYLINLNMNIANKGNTLLFSAEENYVMI